MNFLKLTSESTVYLAECKDGGVLLTWSKSYDFNCTSRVGIHSVYIGSFAAKGKPRCFSLQTSLIVPGPFNPKNEICVLSVDRGSTIAKTENERGFELNLR